VRTEGDYIKINHALLPLSWIYGMAVGIRNWAYNVGLRGSRSFDIPVINVGNITVGGAGKTPTTEYLVRLLKDSVKVAVLSRGYKRKSRGYVLADADTPMNQIGDEPYQMKQKFGDIYVAVDKNRCEGIDRLQTDEATKDVDVILLDDAYQHRAVKPGINILLVDYHRLIIYDKLLPAGRLREPVEGKSRADIVIVTKCPRDLKPMEYRVLMKSMNLYAYQSLFFTSIKYEPLRRMGGTDELPAQAEPRHNALLLTGIASPQQLIDDLTPRFKSVRPMSFPDHHYFSRKDIARINEEFTAMESPKLIVTTEKDAARLKGMEGLSDDVAHAIHVQPITVEFMENGKEYFDNKITSYVHKNSRNSILAKTKNDNKPRDRHHTRDGSRTISFRNN